MCVGQNVEEFGVYLELTYTAKKTRRGEALRQVPGPVIHFNLEKYFLYVVNDAVQCPEVPATNKPTRNVGFVEE